MKTITALAALLLCFAPAFTAFAEEDGPRYESPFDDKYEGSGYYCDDDCRKQDRVKYQRNQTPYEIRNDMDDGRNRRGKSLTDIMSYQLEPASGR